jgi:hypothetical protein
MVINNSLAVIAGNSKPAVKISALWIIASKLFFLRKNDLVVDTDTMIMGTRRSGKVCNTFMKIHRSTILNILKTTDNKPGHFTRIEI